MEVASTPNAKARPAQQSTQNPHLDDEDLIGALQGQTTTTSNFQLGNKLAKPSIVEQSPSAGFIFGRASANVSIRQSAYSEQQLGDKQDRDPIKDTQDSGGVETDTSFKVLSRSSSKVLNLSVDNDAPEARSKSSASSQGPSLAIENSQYECQSQIERSQEPSQLLQEPSHSRELQALASSIDPSTLIKILAFANHREMKLHNQIVTGMRADIESKVEKLDYALIKYNHANALMEDAKCQILALEKEVEHLKQQLANTVPKQRPELNTEHGLEVLEHKIDMLIKETRKQNTENDQLNNAYTTIRQLADDLRQCRKQAERLLSQNKVDIAGTEAPPTPQANENSKIKQTIDCQESSCSGSPRHAFTDTTLIQSHLSKTPDSALANKDGAPEVAHHGGAKIDLESFSESQAILSAELQTPSTPADNSSKDQVSRTQTSVLRSGVNRFCKRRMDTELHSETSRTSDDRAFKKPAVHPTTSESKTPRSRTSSQTRAHRIGNNELKGLNVLTERGASSLPGQASNKNKTSRGQGGG